MIQWAKNQGTKSPYKRLYTPLLTPPVPYRQFPRNRCGQHCLKSRCCCHVLIRDANEQPQRPLFPVKREVKLWKRSERRRKKRQQILGLRSCPRCPKSKGLCVFYPPPKDMAALQSRMSRALDGEEKWSLMPIKHHLIKTLRRKFRNCDAGDDDGDDGDDIRYDINFTALCSWFDQSDTETLFQQVNEEQDVPLTAPDEPFREFSPEDFFKRFDFEPEENYIPQFGLTDTPTKESDFFDF